MLQTVEPLPELRVARPGEVNWGPFDQFTLMHVAVGAAQGAWGLPFWFAAVWGVGWELVERPFKRAVPQWFPHATQDTAPNALWDAMAVMGGWWLGEQLRRRV